MLWGEENNGVQCSPDSSRPVMWCLTLPFLILQCDVSLLYKVLAWYVQGYSWYQVLATKVLGFDNSILKYVWYCVLVSHGVCCHGPWYTLI